MHTALSLAATPTFLVMALLTPLIDGPASLPCIADPGGLPLNGMVVMYALMSGFHLPPWLRLLAETRRLADHPRVGSSDT